MRTIDRHHDTLLMVTGACAFSFGRTWELEAQLMHAPRAAVHEALLRPHTFLEGPEQE